jgi:hypothetical protein
MHERMVKSRKADPNSNPNQDPKPADDLVIEIRDPYKPQTWHARVDPDTDLCYPEWGIIHQYVDWAARSGPSPTLFHTHLAIVMVAWELARRGWVADLRMSSGSLASTPLHLRHWAVGVAGPGVGKSYAANEMEEFLASWMDAFHNQGKSEPDEVPVVSLEGRSTTAGLFDVLNDKCYDEASKLTPGIILSTEASAPFCGAGDLPEIFCELYDCRAVVERQVAHLRAEAKKTGERYRGALLNARCSAMFFTTPNGIEKIGKVLGTNLLEGGLYTRCNFSFPDVDAKQYFGLSFSKHGAHRSACLQSWVDWAKWLDGLEAASHPKVIEMPAWLHKNLRDQFLAALDPDERDKSLEGTFMRLMSRARIVAAVFAMSRGDWTINSDDTDRAFNLVIDSYQSIERLMPQANVAAAPEIQAAARSMSTVAQRIRQEVARAGTQGCPHSDVLHATSLPTQVVQGAIEELVERDEVRVEVTKSASGRGRPAKRYFAISKAERESRRALEEAAQTARTTSTNN